MSTFRIAVALILSLLPVSAINAVSAAQIDAGSVYCFTQEDFSGTEETALSGICITELPKGASGSLMLGTRILREGDILTAEQLTAMTFSPVPSELDSAATVSYLPIFRDHVAPETTLTIAIRGRQNQAPVAQDSAIETYKNLENRGKLKVSDPEDEPMTFRITRQPKRGTVTINEDGSFLYTPKHNKVGVDSFTFTATDSAGNVSREATVTITILKPTDSAQYRDTCGRACRFSAEWMRNTGIFVAENIGGEACFQPEKAVTRGEFVTMLVKSLDLPVDDELTLTGYTDDIPDWLKPYLTAAVRSGLTSGLNTGETFGAYVPITGGEAAQMLQNALDLSPEEGQSVMAVDEEALTDAQSCIAVLSQNGILLEMDTVLNRETVAETLYLASELAEHAPGMAALRLK